MSDPSQKKPILAKAELTSSSLSYAFELQTLAAQAGFDWPDISGVVDKINEELSEVIAEINIQNNEVRLKDEIGDLLFACINLARHLNIDPEQALQSGNKKFCDRFTRLEQIVDAEGKNINDRSLAQLEQLWQKVKQEHNN
jgi:ATP diphosphatase|tara:strand:- start:464 stop:886 length:423 start_codon:yes stop_codon:yes gene_type:complete